MKIKILVFGLSSNLGGIKSFFINTIKHNKSNIIYDFVLSEKNSYSDKLLTVNSKIHYIKNSRRNNPLKYYREIKEIIKSDNYTYVWQNVMSRSNLAPIKYASKNNVNTILHIHGSGQSESSIISKLLHRMNKRTMISNTDLYFTCSKESSKFAFGNKHKYAIFIPNAIDFNKFYYIESYNKDIRKEFNIDNDTFVIGNVARLTPVKNIKFLIDIFKHINSKINNSKLLIVGDGPLLEELQEYVKQKGLNNKVVFTGSRNDVNKILSALDCYIMPSLSEGLGISMLEAQVANLNVYTSSVVPREVKISKDIRFLSLNEGSLTWAKEVIKDYKNGYINKKDKIIEEKALKFNIRENVNLIEKILIDNK